VTICCANAFTVLSDEVCSATCALSMSMVLAASTIAAMLASLSGATLCLIGFFVVPAA